ncbi:DUF317 domain-containing protein [Streptomyces amakusaensis]|uniref:DUF317 domain-containing protein n=1 Tax=Streptomyces amakusaensis TaxID=67271 RepID=A0ABW0AJW5_9ACTN
MTSLSEIPSRPSPSRITTASDNEVYVSPRHLAGSTAYGDPGLQPALDSGWKISYDDHGNVLLPSPDQRIRIGYLPEGDDDALWKIAAYQSPFEAPRWAAAFSSDCPTEFVTAFTSALVPLHEPEGNAFLTGGIGPRLHPVFPVLKPLLDAGWKLPQTWRHPELRSPDGLAGAWFDRSSLDPAGELTSNHTRWGMWGGSSYGRWYAVFSTGTPTRLITATAAAVADPTPVLRWPGELSRMTRARATITPVRPPAPTPLEMARARRPVSALRTITVPRWSTSTPSARLPGPSRPAARR